MLVPLWRKSSSGSVCRSCGGDGIGATFSFEVGLHLVTGVSAQTEAPAYVFLFVFAFFCVFVGLKQSLSVYSDNCRAVGWRIRDDSGPGRNGSRLGDHPDSER